MNAIGRKLITADQLAGALNVPKSWIYDRTRQGPEAIPFIRLGAYVRFDAEEVINFFKTHGSKSIINHRNTETTERHELTDNARGGEQVRSINRLHQAPADKQGYQRAASHPEPKKYGLADR